MAIVRFGMSPLIYLFRNMLTFDNELVAPVGKYTIIIYMSGLRRRQQCDATIIMVKIKIQKYN